MLNDPEAQKIFKMNRNNLHDLIFRFNCWNYFKGEFVFKICDSAVWRELNRTIQSRANCAMESYKRGACPCLSREPTTNYFRYVSCVKGRHSQEGSCQSMKKS